MFVSREGQQPRLEPIVVDLQHEHRVARRAASFRRTARVENPRRAVPRRLGHVGVAVDDRVAGWEEPHEPRRPPHGRAGHVHHPDAQAVNFDDPPLGRRDGILFRKLQVEQPCTRCSVIRGR